MQAKIMIRTPAGQAKGTEAKIKPFIIGIRKNKYKVYTDRADSKIIWIVEGSIRELIAIQRNVMLFDRMVAQVMQNRIVQGAARLTKDQKKELEDMFKHHTSIKILTANEIEQEDLDNPTLWELS